KIAARLEDPDFGDCCSMQGKRSAVAIRHVAFEDLGLLSRVLDDAGWQVTFCDAAVDDLWDRNVRDAGLLIVLGGPIGVTDVDTYPFLRREIDILERRLARRMPTLGICLGSQLMARALGANVYAGNVKEIGWGRVQLTEEGRQSCLGELENASA